MMRSISSGPLARCLFPALAAAIVSATADAADELPIPIAKVEREEPVDFHGEVMPLLRRSCVACHHEGLAEGGLNLETVQAMLTGGDSGPAIVAGKSDESLLLHRATGEEEPLMPPEDNAAKAPPLAPEELGLVSLWIEQGAQAGSAATTDSPQWQPIPESFRPIYAVDVSPNGRLVAAGRGNAVAVYDLDSQEELARLVDPNLPESLGEAADVDLIQSLAFSPDGRRIATGGFRTVKIWEKYHQPVSPEAARWQAACGPVAVSADQSRVAVTMPLQEIAIYNGDADEPQLTLRGHRHPIRLVAFDAEAKRLLSGDSLGRVVAWNVESGEELAAVTAESPIREIAANAAGDRIAIVDVDGRARLYKLSGDEPSFESIEPESLKELSDASTVIALAGEPPRFAIGTQSGEVRLIVAEQGDAVRTIKTESPVSKLAATSDGSRILSASSDGQVKLWNAESGEAAASPDGRAEFVSTLQRIDSDLQRQKARLERLKTTRETLDKRLEGEEEAIKKATEERNKAKEKLAEEQKKHQAAVDAVTADEAEIAKLQKQIEETKKKLAAAGEAVEKAKKQKEAAEKAAAEKKAAEKEAAEKEAAENEAGEEAEQSEDADSEDATEAQAEQPEPEAADDAPAKLAAEIEKLEAQRKQHEAESTRLETELKKLTDGLEAKKKAVEAAKAELDKADAEVKKLQPALDALLEAKERLQRLIAEHEATTAAEQRELKLLESTRSDWDLQSQSRTVPIRAAAFAAEANRFATLDAQGLLSVFAGDEPTVRATIDVSDALGSPGPVQLRFFDAETIAIHETGRPAVFRRLQPSWRLSHQIGTPEESPLSDRVMAIDFHPQHDWIAVGSGPASRAGQVLIFTADGRPVREFADAHSDTVLSVRFSPDGRVLASSAADKVIRLLDVHAGNVIRSLEGHTHHVTSITWNDDAVTLVSAGADQTLKVWDTESGEQKRTIPGIGKEATAVRFVGRTGEVLSAAADGNVRLHNTGDGKAIRSYAAGGDFLFSLGVTPDGSRVVSGGQDGVLRSWTVADGQLISEFK